MAVRLEPSDGQLPLREHLDTQPAGHDHPRWNGPELRHPLQRHPRGVPERAALEGRRHHRQRRRGGPYPQRLVVDAHRRHRQRRPVPGRRDPRLPVRQRRRADARLQRVRPGPVQDDDAERLLPAQQPVPEQPQRRLHHQLLGQLGPVHHELDPRDRDPVRRRRQVRPGRHLLQDRRGQRLRRPRRPVPPHRLRRATPSASGRRPAATRRTASSASA